MAEIPPVVNNPGMNSWSPAEYDELADILFNPEYTTEERHLQKIMFRHKFADEKSLADYGRLVITILHDEIDTKYMDIELQGLMNGR